MVNIRGCNAVWLYIPAWNDRKVTRLFMHERDFMHEKSFFIHTIRYGRGETG